MNPTLSQQYGFVLFHRCHRVARLERTQCVAYKYVGFIQEKLHGNLLVCLCGHIASCSLTAGSLRAWIIQEAMALTDEFHLWMLSLVAGPVLLQSDAQTNLCHINLILKQTWHGNTVSILFWILPTILLCLHSIKCCTENEYEINDSNTPM